MHTGMGEISYTRFMVYVSEIFVVFYAIITV